jgi:hypothetical protein
MVVTAHQETISRSLKKRHPALYCAGVERLPSLLIIKGFSMNQPATSNGLLFPLGDLVATPGALSALEKNGIVPMRLIARHMRGDWGDVPHEDAAANTDAVRIGARLLSSYALPDHARIWIITEADRSSTTLILPDEY